MFAGKAEVEAVRESELIELQEQRHVETSIKFEFIMDSLVIELFTGGSKMVFFYFLLMFMKKS